MSNVSEAHDVRPFTAGDKPLSGQRLAKIGYKKTKDQPNPPQSVCVSIPFPTVSDLRANIDALLPYVSDLIEQTQDRIIRTAYEAALSDGRSFDVVTDSELSVSACLSFLAAEREGSRLTNDAIEHWFDAELSDSLTAYVFMKLYGTEGEPTVDQMVVVKKHVRIYRELISSLAGGKTILAEKQIKGCRTALSLVDGAMVGRLTARLDTMERKNQADFLDL